MRCRQIIFQNCFVLELVNISESCSESCTGGMQKVTFLCNGTVGTCSLSITGLTNSDLNPGSSFNIELPCNDEIPCGELVYSV